MLNPAGSQELSAAQPTGTGPQQGTRTLKVVVSGASGLIGSQVCQRLGIAGHEVRKLVRRVPESDGHEIQWDPGAGRLQLEELAGTDVFVHLSGENIASGRWTDSVRRRIRDSRVNSTRLLSETIARLKPLPKMLIAASAIGYYGNRGDTLLTEDSAAGSGFLPEVCQEWEAAAAPARDAGIHVVNLRTGVVLSKAGGALAKMLGPFRMGLGGVVGSGQQWMSWIALSDVTRAIEFLLHTDLSGPLNVVAPQPVTNREFTQTLGSILKRPTVMPIPATVLHLTLGQMADETLLASTRVIPERLLAAGFIFEHSRLDEALRHELA